MRLWAEERRTGTVELLLTLPVTPMQAILGKFLAAWGFLVLALALTFPVVLSAYYLGRPDAGVIVSGYIGSALLAGGYVAVGMMTSALTRNQVIAFVLAVIIGLFLMLAGFPPVTGFLGSRAPMFAEAMAALSFISHFEAMQRGIIDLRDVLYFASVIAFMLFTTQVVLQSRTGK